MSRLTAGNKFTKEEIDSAVMARLRAPFNCEFIASGAGAKHGRWRIYDANDDAVASTSGLEEGYARLIVQALNEHFELEKLNDDENPGGR